MNRRGFIGTITALAGVVLAKIKAPAAPKYVAGCDSALLGADQTAICVQRISPWIWDEHDYKHYAEFLVQKKLDNP